MYYDLFTDWKSVQDEFSMDEPEPDEVLVAAYEYEDYSGSADVFYRRGDKYYSVSAGHCSCYGLEGQWEPTEYTKDELVAALEKGQYYHKYCDINDVRGVVLSKLKGEA